MITNQKDGILDLISQGQPMMNANFYSDKIPSSFQLIHKIIIPEYQQKMLGI